MMFMKLNTSRGQSSKKRQFQDLWRWFVSEQTSVFVIQVEPHNSGDLKKNCTRNKWHNYDKDIKELIGMKCISFRIFFFILSKKISSCVVDCGWLFENDGELKLKLREIYVCKK